MPPPHPAPAAPRSSSMPISSRREQLALAAGIAFGATLCICAFSLVLDHFSGIWNGTEQRLATQSSLALRLFPVVGIAIAAVLFAVADGHPLRRSAARIFPIPLLCLLGLAILVVGGSWYSRISGNTESFFTMGAAILAGPLTYWAFEFAPDRERLVRIMLIATASGTVPILASSIAKFAVNEGAFVEYFPVPFAAATLAWFLWPQTPLRIALGVAVTGLCLLSLKKTGVITLGALTVPIAIDLCIRRFGATRRTALILLAATLVTGLATVGLFVMMDTAYRSGEHDFRSYSFEFAWNEFTRSPIWGKFYLGSSTIINPYYPTERVAVHNDVLDVMRQGGLLALLPFLIGTLWPLWILSKRRRQWRLAPPALCAMATSSIGCYAIFLFNPVLLGTDSAVVVWAMIGCGLWHCKAFETRIEREETSAWRRR